MLEAVSEALEPDHLGAVMILTFVIIFIVASAWDVRHVNRVLGTMVNPGGKQTYYR